MWDLMRWHVMRRSKKQAHPPPPMTHHRSVVGDVDDKRAELEQSLKRVSGSRSKELRERRAGVIKSAKDETKRRRLGVHGRKSG